MKKLVSILCTLAVLTANVQITKVNAVNNNTFADTENNGIPYLITDESTVNMVKDSENPDLYALASSLGADTDYFNFLNYAPESVSDETRNLFNRKLTQKELWNYNEEILESPLQFGGVCHGISTLQILVHNGVISPSDIQAGAETLHDIAFDEKINDIITYYQAGQVHIKNQYIMNYYKYNTYKSERYQDLIKLAQDCMQNNKYFYIAFSAPSFKHAVAGIGIAEGNWQYNDKNYDKCILTLDCNVANSDKTAAFGFRDDTCIYINSETNEFYIPGYKFSDEDSSILYFTDDESFLNYKGMINPSETINADTSSVRSISIANYKKCDYDLTITDENGSETYHASASDDLGLCKNSSQSLGANNYYIKTGENDSYKLNIGSAQNKYKHGFDISIHNENTGYYLYTPGQAEYGAEISKNKISITNKENEKFEKELSNACIMTMTLGEEDLNSYPFSEFSVEEDFAENLTIENTEDGVIISDTNGLQGYIAASRFFVDEDGVKHLIDDYAQQMEGDCGDPIATRTTFRMIGEVKSVLIKYDEEIDRAMLWFDKDEDGIYESPIQKGDANTDGVIDASDASSILASYAELSSGRIDFAVRCNPYICDYNGDNQLNASDASEVLAYYADISSGKFD